MAIIPNIPNLKIGDLVSRLPIVQGGMGVGISMSGMASAVANEGGIGVIAAAMAGIHEADIYKNSLQANLRVLRQEIRKAREKTQGIIGVNIMVALTHYAEMVKCAINEKVDIIFSGAGLPLDLPRHLTGTVKTKLAPIVSSGRAASIICKKWLAKFDYLPDAFVVEGPMAGGHIGFKTDQIDNPKFSLENLLKEVKAALRPYEQQRNNEIPVIAAGGIFTGADIHKYLQMGAAGVQMGTRFVTTHECDADLAFKQAYLNAHEEDMVVIKSPVGMPGRAVRNLFLDAVAKGVRKPFRCPYQCLKTCTAEESPYCIAMALGNARKGKLKHGFAFAGKNAYRIDKIISVKELMQSLLDEYKSALLDRAPAQNPAS